MIIIGFVTLLLLTVVTVIYAGCSLIDLNAISLSGGVSDWGYLIQKIYRHKDSIAHLKAVISEKLWLDKRRRIDKELEKQLFEQSNNWFSILQRFVDITFTIPRVTLLLE